MVTTSPSDVHAPHTESWPADPAPDDAWQDTPAPAEFHACAVPWIETEEVPACAVCGVERFDLYTVGFDYELRTCRNPWRFVQCRACGHVWLNPRPALAALPVIYPPTYYSYNYKQQINRVARWAKALLDRRKMRAILRRLPAAPATYLDVGCGDGRFLKVMEAQGVRREHNYGLELDANVVRPLAEAGFQAFCERVEECGQIPDGRIDLATMFHVIEHVDDPGRVVRKVADWLAPGGVFAVETPNLASLDRRWFQHRHWGGYHIPRHWHLFTPATLSRLLRDSGLEVIGTSYQTGHSFWMYSFHHRLRYANRPWPRLARLFDPLKGLPFLAAFTAFDKLRAAVGFPTSAMLLLARKPGGQTP
jgi:SAM-dependent methyltransferase